MTGKPPVSIARRAALALVAAAIAGPFTGLAPGAALADGWPNGAVQLVVPAKPGGGTDAGARIIAAKLQEVIGAPVVIVNNPGGGGAVAAEQVRTAAPDGQTLLYYHTGLLTVYATGGFEHDPLEAFTTVASLPVGGSFAVAVPASSPYQTMEELVQASKDNPDKITFGVQMRGGSHFMSGLLAGDSGAQFRIVEAGSDADKFVALQGAQIDAGIVNTPGTLAYVESGDLRILATIAGTPERDPGAPDYPSLHELGYENSVYGTDFLVLAPAGLDEGTAETINAAFNAALEDSTVADQLAQMRMPIGPMGLAESRERIADAARKTVETAKAIGLTD